MPYDDPTLKEFAGYFKAKEPGRRERAEKAAFDQGGKSRLLGKSGQKKVVRKGCQKTADRIFGLLKDHPNLTQVGLVAALGISRQAIQKHIANLKAAGRLRRIGPDKGGHWEVVE